jgi:hypothetical protein
MNFTELKAELIARGFDSLTDARAGVYINNARAELDRIFLWPWREASVTGVSPLTISDLAGANSIEKVINTSQSSTPLSRCDWSTLVDLYGDLSTSGTPSYYYIASPGGSFEVATVPVSSSDVIGVQYWALTPDLVNASDTPTSPSQAHYTIVDLAARRAYRDNDEHDAATALQPEIDNAISQLLEAYPPGTPDGPEAYVGVTFASEDW